MIKLKITRNLKNKFTVNLKNKSKIIQELGTFSSFEEAKDFCDIVKKRDGKFNV